MKITLKDGSCKEYAEPMAIIDIAKDISEGLARVACVAELDGEVVDLRTVVDGEHELNILTFDSDAGKADLPPHRIPCAGTGGQTSVSTCEMCDRTGDRGRFLL